MLSNCGHFREEDQLCNIDDGLCTLYGCMFYKEPEPEDQGDPWEHSHCVLSYDPETDIASFTCTMPEWI